MKPVVHLIYLTEQGLDQQAALAHTRQRYGLSQQMLTDLILQERHEAEWLLRATNEFVEQSLDG